MNREIKFRGKNTVTNKWVFGGYYKHLKRTPSPIEDSIKDDDWQHLIINSSFSDWGMPKGLECFDIDEKTVGQYTGLKDDNGVEIYEGDLIPYHFNEDIKGVVRFGEYKNPCDDMHAGHIGFYLEFNDPLKKDILRKDLEYWIKVSTVVGNIYENK